MTMPEKLHIKEFSAWKRVFAAANPSVIYFVESKYMEKLRVAANRNNRHCFAVKITSKEFMVWLPLYRDFDL